MGPGLQSYLKAQGIPPTAFYLMAGHLTMCALQPGQECEVLIPGPHVQWDSRDQTTLQEASTHQVRSQAQDSRTQVRGLVQEPLREPVPHVLKHIMSQGPPEP